MASFPHERMLHVTLSSTAIVTNNVPFERLFFIHELMKYVVSNTMIVNNWQLNIPISKAFFLHELI